MTRDDLREKIARAIYICDGSPEADWESEDAYAQSHYEEAADAVLAAIAEAGMTVVPRDIDEGLADVGLGATGAWLSIPGSAMTVNREKMRRRYVAIVAATDLARAPEPADV